MSKESFSKGSEIFGDMNKRKQRVLKNRMEKIFQDEYVLRLFLQVENEVIRGKKTFGLRVACSQRLKHYVDIKYFKGYIFGKSAKKSLKFRS